jgi:hypothetical protein
MTLAALALALSFAPQSTDDVVAKMINEAKTNSQAMKSLQDLTSKFGPRLTSSSNLEKAQRWMADQFKRAGCTNVHLEAWGSIPVGFDRGRNSFGRMNKPVARQFEFTSPSWTEGTKGATKGLAIVCPKDKAELEAVKDKLKGAWVVMDRQPRRSRPGAEAPSAEVQAQIDLDAAIDGLGIAGRVYGSRSELVITSGSFRDKTFEKHPMDRSVTIRKSDMDALKATIAEGKPVELEFNLDQKFRKGPVVQHNVIAEIKGTEKPDEVVIISGHIDSWDGPGAVGASDNGTGSCTALEAARLLLKAGAKPKRTIRFILWGGEEQGLYGSRSYVIQHEKEMDKISAVFVDDGGSNYIGGYNGHPDMKPMLQKGMDQVVAAFPDLPMRYTERANPRTQIGSDQDSFNAVGVPGFFTLETGSEKYGTQDYNFIHHTQHDTMKYVIPMYMVQSSVAHAVVGLQVANADTMLPRYPKFEYKLNPDGVPGLAALLMKK